MVMKDLLFEIGIEELPASYIQPALESLVKHLSESLSKAKLTYSEIEKYSTPRRLSLCVKSLPLQQEDEKIEKIGPAISVAYNPDGTLSKAGSGFIKSAGINPEAVVIKKTDKGDYIKADVLVIGKKTEKILQQILPESIKKITFPKTMYWNSKNVTFARPIRWLVAIFGDDLINFEYDGLKTGRVTYGNVLNIEAKQINIDKIEDYSLLLESSYVICDRDRRKELIREQLTKLAISVNGEVNFDGGLLDEVTDIVEYPTAVLASFNEKYLQLPQRIIHSTLSKNQKYFSLYSKDKKQMLNSFIFIANNLPEYASNTKDGNERVVKARLDDAVFYYQEDLQRSRAYFNERLSKMVFQAELGTIKDKIDRIVDITSYLSDKLKLEQDLKDKAIRAASICKFDLATNMIAEKEFTGLQGYIGMNYAVKFGEDHQVAQAIEEHYLPLSFTDKLPQTIIGIIIALADKIDTLCGIFGIGRIPTGSNDPFALRRAGNGIVRILYENELSVNLPDLIDFTYCLINKHLKEADKNKVEILNFFKQRAEWLLEQNKIDYDIINAVIIDGFSEITLLKKKVKALQALRNREDFESLILSFKRVSNIIAKEKDFKEIDPGLFSEDAEKDLYQVLKDLEEESIKHLTEQDYMALLESFISIKDKIDLFFDKVLVNVEENSVRNNRYALLYRLRKLFLQVGDLSLIVIEGEK
ncbi:MAG: glycine--tRNA ligase subunit beta [Candidatus Cloacimonetes bacterium]|nr:glycine--tRNA ligase subunit beta [Candidatus Cloacimonadota bacterium]